MDEETGRLSKYVEFIVGECVIELTISENLGLTASVYSSAKMDVWTGGTLVESTTCRV